MDKSGVFAAILLVLFVSGTCDASGLHRLRKLTAGQQKNDSAVQQVPPIQSPGIEHNDAAMTEGKSDSGTSSDISTGKLPDDSSESKKHETLTDDSRPLSPTRNNNDSSINENGTKPAAERSPSDKESKETSSSIGKMMGNGGGCNVSMISCQDQGLSACIETLRDSVSKKLFLVVDNQRESTLKVKVTIPDHIIDELLELEVAAGDTAKMDVSSTVANNKTIVLTSGDAKCVLHLASPYSASSLMQQLSFRYIQATPIFVVYIVGVIVLLLGGIVAFCMIKRRKKQNEIPYQELEMGLPVSSDNAAEGWDDEWDNDDWNESNAVRSPVSQSQTPANGITSRSSAKEGWDSDWED